MDVNEQDRLSNFTLKTQTKVKEQRLYWRSTFHSQSGIQQWAQLMPWNECDNAPMCCMSVIMPLACSWAVLFTSVDKYYIFVVLMLFGFISQMQGYQQETKYG